MRLIFAVVFLILAAPSMVFILWISGTFWGQTALTLAASPDNGEVWSELLVMPGGPMALGAFAIMILTVFAVRYMALGNRGIAQATGKLVVALLCAAIPLLFTLPLAIVTIYRETAWTLLGMAALGSGLGPLIALMFLLGISLRARAQV